MFCNYCGASNPKDALFCSACGKRTAAGSESAAAQAPAAAAVPSAAAPAAMPVTPQDAIRPAAAPPVVQAVAGPQPAAAKGGGRFLWILAGLALLATIIGMSAINKNRSSESSSDSGSSSYTAAPAPEAPRAADPPPQIIDDTPPAEPAPAAPAPPAPTPQNNSIVGVWKTPTPLGDTTVELGADGRYTVKGTFVDDYGIYVYSNDGSLQLQSKSFFDGSLEIWHCQVNGDTMSVIESKGGSHIYTRVN